MSYKDPSFQDRVGAAAEARKKALDKLKAKPPIDEAVVAQRVAAREAKDAAEAAKRQAKRDAEEQARAEKAARLAAAAEAAAAAAAKKAAVPVLTDAEKKAARDAKYAARKNRK